jgi:hypothetical protein
LIATLAPFVLDDFEAVELVVAAGSKPKTGVAAWDGGAVKNIKRPILLAAFA